MYRPIVLAGVLALCLAGCGAKSKEALEAEGAKQLKAGNVNGAIVLFKSALEKDQNFVEARYQLALAYVASGKLDQAEKELQKLQRQDPSRARVTLDLATLYNITGRSDLALAEAKRFLEGHPQSAEAYEVLGAAHATKGSLDEAEQDCLKALQLEPGRAAATMLLARVKATQGKVNEARALLEALIAREPKNAKAFRMLALLELSQGNKEQALADYKKVMEIAPGDVNARYQCAMLLLDKHDTEGAHKLAGELLGSYPKRPEGHLLRGIVLYQKKEYNEAVIELEKTLQLGKAPLVYYYLGLSHYSRGEFELALGQLHKALEMKPNMGQARLMVATILLKQKRLDDAISEAQQAAQAEPKNPLVHSILGSALLARGQAEQGLKELNLALELEPKLMDAHLKKGLYSISTGRVREGEIELENAVRVAPDVLDTRYVLAAYQMRRGENDKAAETFRQGLKGQKSDAVLLNAMSKAYLAGKKEAESLRSLQKAKEVDPGFLATYFNLAQYYSTRGAVDKALNEYAEVLKRDPQNVQALQRMGLTLETRGNSKEALNYLTRAKETKKPEGYLALADFLVRAKQTDKAIGVLQEAVQNDPQNSTALETQGKLLAGQKKYAEALNCFDRLEALSPERAAPLKVTTAISAGQFGKAADAARAYIGKQPRSGAGYLLLGSVYQAQNDFGRAEQALRDGVRAEGGSYQARIALARLYVAKKNYPEALALFQEVLQKQPGNLSALFALGTVYQQMGKNGEAARRYRDTLKKDGNHVAALNNLAYLCANGEGSKSEALRLASRASQLEPENPGVMDTLGYCLLVNGKKEDAARLLLKAAALLPNEPAVYYHLALVYRDQGNRPQAVKNLQKSLQLGDFPEAAQAKQLLAQLKG